MAFNSLLDEKGGFGWNFCDKIFPLRDRRLRISDAGGKFFLAASVFDCFL